MSTKILIIDDDERLITVHSMILETEGFEVTTSPDGRSGLVKIEEMKPDLVLLDAMMPGFSGYDTLTAIKENPKTNATKVVMLTALSDENMKEKAMSLGADDYIIKSQLTAVELIAKIHSLIPDKQ